MLGTPYHAQACTTAKAKRTRKGVNKWMRLNASGERVANPKKKRRSLELTEEEAADFIAWSPPEMKEYRKRFVEKQRVKAAKKRVHSKAYSKALYRAKKEGKSAEEAKALARNAGSDALRAWTDIVGTWSDSTRAWSDIRVPEAPSVV